MVQNEHRILLVDDDFATLEGMADFFRRRGWTVQTAADAAAARQLVTDHPPAVAVVDIVLPARAGEKAQHKENLGLELARWIKQMHPSVGIVVRSAYPDRGNFFWNLVQTGYRGVAYRLKGEPPAALLQAVEAVLHGEVNTSPGVVMVQLTAADFMNLLDPLERRWVDQAATRLDYLSPREREIAHLLAAARDAKGVAQTLGITPKSAANYATRIYGKLQLNQVDRDQPYLRKAVLLSKALLLARLRGQG